MSTVKIKAEPAEAATVATAVVDIQVKLEPSLSTAGDIKLEQHSSDIDTKVESDSEADSEEDDIKSESDDDGEDEDTDQIQRKFICDHPECGCSFNSASHLALHRREHKLHADISINGKALVLSRQSLTDRWSCPIPGCASTLKTVGGVCSHIRRCHGDDIKQQQQSPPQKTKRNYHFDDVDNFYVNGVRCGYHTTTALFLCYKCRLVPECLLTHLQQKHGYDEKSIDNSVLPDSAINANADPNINQHTSNPHLALAIGQSSQQQHQDIIQGWICVTSDCGYCGSSTKKKNDHKRKMHRGERLATVPALLLRLMYNKMKSSYFLINRLDQASGAVTSSSNRVNQHKLDYSHNGLNAQDDNGDDVDQNETADESNQKRQWQCEYPNCRCSFNTSGQLSSHRREHKLEDLINVHGTTFVLNRQSSDDRWACPVPGCEKMCNTIRVTLNHIRGVHGASLKHKRASSDDENNQQQQIIKRKQFTRFYFKVDSFYVNDIRCGYYNTIGVFVCQECRLVPECLSTHLQQKHGYSEKSVDNSALPESAVNARTDPTVNQHTSNQFLTAVISQPYQPQHPDIIQGWLCVTSDCGYCGHTTKNKHRLRVHNGENISTVPALVLRLVYAKTQTSCFLITRLDTTVTTVNSNNFASQQNNEPEEEDDDECDDDDGDELVLSDYSD